MSAPWPVSVAAGVLLVAMAVGLVAFGWSLPPRARWVLVVRESFLALVGVGVAVEPWFAHLGGSLAFVGLVGMLVMTVLGRRLRGELRTTP